MEDLKKAPLDVSLVPAAEGPVIVIRGEIDGSNVDTLRELVDRQLAEQPRQLAFDLADVRFMDSSGIAFFIRASKQVPEFRVLRPSPNVLTVLTMTGVTEVLGVEQ